MDDFRVLVKKLHDDSVVPTYGTDYSAGADLYAYLDCEEITTMPGETVFCGTGIAIAIPDGYAGLVFARSGLSCKHGLAPANKVGVIDPDYRGEIKVALHNHSAIPEKISNGDRIAQLLLVPFIRPSLVESDVLDETGRSSGGFGSTGKS